MVVPSKRRTYQEQGIGGPNQPPHSPTREFFEWFSIYIFELFYFDFDLFDECMSSYIVAFLYMLSLCFWDYLLPRLFVALVNFCLLVSHCLLMDGNNKLFF